MLVGNKERIDQNVGNINASSDHIEPNNLSITRRLQLEDLAF